MSRRWQLRCWSGNRKFPFRDSVLPVFQYIIVLTLRLVSVRWEPLQVKPAPGQWDPIGQDMGQAH
jgi:hypothetical protein